MGINFNDRPPPAAQLSHLPLKRVGKAAEIGGAITCWEAVQTNTHFVHRRTLPCLGENCPGCAEKKPKRYEAYVSIWTNTPSVHLIVALTPLPMQQLFDQVANPTQLRGHIVRIMRKGNRPNGPLTLQVLDTMQDPSKLPPAPVLVAHLLNIWGLNASHIGQDHPDYAACAELLGCEERSPNGQGSRPT